MFTFNRLLWQFCAHAFVMCATVQGEGVLHHQWTNRPLQSKVAQDLNRLNQQCVNRGYGIYPLNNYGMGSSIGSCLIKATCNALQDGKPLRTLASGVANKWIWNDEEFCNKQSSPYDMKKTKNPLQCYFGNVFTPCSGSDDIKLTAGVWWQTWRCPRYIHHIGNSTAVGDFAGATTEYLFSQVNPAIVKMAEKEALKIFGSKGAPDNMITVHIRWGDKKHEMGGSLVPIEEYINAVNFFIRKHSLKSNEVNIFLTTEDPEAAHLFKTHETAVQQKWTIYEYAAAVSSNKKMHTPALDAQETKGKFGIISMIVLLLSMEAQYFVLTTASNWSVLMQSLVHGVLRNGSRKVDYVDLRRNPLGLKQQYDFNMRHKLPRNYPYNNDGVLAFPIGSSIK